MPSIDASNPFPPGAMVPGPASPAKQALDKCSTIRGIGPAASRRRLLRAAAVPVAFVATATALAMIPDLSTIPPLIESDYCYQLLAADRMLDGLGPTSLNPVAPGQPWQWQTDWSWLTRWPMGYAALIYAVRSIASLSSIDAARWISIAACALAFVGWFTWVRRSTAKGLVGALLGVVAAGCGVSTAGLINPSTDALLAAMLPFVLLLLTSDRPQPSISRLVLGGLLAGGLCWIRYAAVFVPIGIALALLLEVAIPRRQRFMRVLAFALSTAVPIVALLTLNRLAGAGALQSQLNLGHSIGFDFSWGLLWQTWWHFTNLPFYGYLSAGHWLFALWPMVFVAGVTLVPAIRKGIASSVSPDSIRLGGCLVLALLSMLVGATVLFADKFDYVNSLDRYYQPLRPIYVVLFVAPLALLPSRVLRIGAVVGLVVAGNWLVRYEWPRPYQRWVNARRVATPYGQWARCFTPGADELYGWLRAQANPSLIIFSNYHEYVAMETGLPAIPIPPDGITRDRWIDQICQARGIDNPRVLFVLDDDNRWREYWQPNPEDVKRQFRLDTPDDVPAFVAQFVYIEG